MSKESQELVFQQKLSDWFTFMSKVEKNEPRKDFWFDGPLKSNWTEKFKNKLIYEKRFQIPDVPVLEKAARGHKDGLEEKLPAIMRQVARPIESFRLQYGRTCSLTSFQMILGALGKKVPTYEEVMGKPWHEINGSGSRDNRRFLGSQGTYSDIKETVLSVDNFKNGKNDILRESIFKLLDGGSYLFVLVNWQTLHGRRHPDTSPDTYDHAVVLSGARETLEPVQGDQINYLITDPNHPSYHNIWIPEKLLFKSMLHSAEIYGYRIEKPKITERIRKRLSGRRPVRAYSY